MILRLRYHSWVLGLTLWGCAGGAGSRLERDGGARWLVSGMWGRDVREGFACVVGGDEGVRENCMPARGPLGMGSVCVILISYGRFVWWRMDGMG